MAKKDKLDGVTIPKDFDLNTNSFLVNHEDAMEILIAICKGDFIGGVLSGPAGCGKTNLLKQLQRRFDANLHPVKDPDTGEITMQPPYFFHYINPDANSIADQFYKYSKPNDIIIIEDNVRLIRRESLYPYLLAFLDPSPAKGKRMIDDTKGRNGEFEVQSRLIFSANDDIGNEKFADTLPDALRGQFTALLRRIARSSFHFPHDDVQLYHYACYVLITSKYFKRIGLDHHETNEVLMYFFDHFNYFRVMAISTLEDLAITRKKLRGYKHKWASFLGGTEEERKLEKRKGNPGCWLVGHTARVQRIIDASSRRTERASLPLYPLLLDPNPQPLTLQGPSDDPPDDPPPAASAPLPGPEPELDPVDDSEAIATESVEQLDDHSPPVIDFETERQARQEATRRRVDDSFVPSVDDLDDRNVRAVLNESKRRGRPKGKKDTKPRKPRS